MQDRRQEREARRRQRQQRARLQRIILILAVILAAVLIVAVATRPEKLPAGTAQSGKFRVTLLGDLTQTVEFGTEYTDPGLEAVYDDEAVTPQIKTELPDLTKLGIHTLRYTVTYEGKTLHLERKLQVVDTKPPVLTLLTVPGHYTPVGGTYVDEGCMAVDNYDGDISHKVTAVQDRNTVTYTAADSSGNTATVTRTIVYGDSLAPEISFVGGETVIIPAGTEFADPGFTATDNIDGDLTAGVTVTGEYDRYLPGTYTFTYTVTDAHGNTATAIRTLIVEALTQPDIVDPGDKVIYLTFDDGPTSHTPRLLEILEKYNVKATFFVVGNSMLEYMDDIVQAGHSIGIHTYSHEYNKIYAGEDAFFKDFYAIRDTIYDRTGVYTTLTRFPGGSSNMESAKYCKGLMTLLTKEVTAQGYQYFDWNVDSNDAGGTKTAEGVFQNVIDGIRSNRPNVVLQHDLFGYSVDAVERIIQWGLANGYTFLPLDPTSPNAHHNVRN